MKVYSPNKEYTGISASVPFCNGTGETDDPHLIEWFKEHGYTVEEPMEAEIPMKETVERFKPKLQHQKENTVKSKVNIWNINHM